ncbi:unnamed protein product [Gongylonema pulchrum]|uniref:Uncharacterized protein n=1 Tax=Gongylonema pulchrum TaxID=637853 RepID=A0A3P7NNY2_9BILA|nr:unnamed protein product [Gongylonema pulchrum]
MRHLKKRNRNQFDQLLEFPAYPEPVIDFNEQEEVKILEMPLSLEL